MRGVKIKAVKAYKIPIEAPKDLKDLIEDYFRVKKKALEEILKHIKYSKSGKAHLSFSSEERRKLRNELLKDWKYSKHYVDSAINSVIGLVKGGSSSIIEVELRENLKLLGRLFTSRTPCLHVRTEFSR